MKNFLNLKFFVVFFAVLIIGLLFPFHQTEAWIGALAANIAFSGIAAILELVVLLTSAILFICRLLLVIAISPSLITVPYTSGGIVDVGWPIVRDFANLGFTLALVFIGLATALQLDEYGAKKALPRLLAMALLVNFTPVIAGIIVDASNIIMNFFLGATGDFTAITNLGGSHYSSTLNKLGGSWGKSISLEIIAEAATISIFNLLAGFFFLLYAFLFLTRYVAIWALVIVSPLAFFANVFPKASSYYKQWWQQFIQWCFIGVPASFFLYLSWHLLDQADAIIIAPAPSAWSNFVGIGPILSSMLVYGVVLIFLFLGFLTSLSSGAVGATAIISTAKGWGKSSAKFAGRVAKGDTKAQREIKARAGRAIIGSKLAGDTLEKMATSKDTGVGGWLTRRVGMKGLEMRYGAANEVEKRRKDPRIQAYVKNKDSAAMNALLTDPTIDPTTKIAAFMEMADSWDESDMTRNKEIPLSRMKQIIGMAAGRGFIDAVRNGTKDKPSFSEEREVINALIDPEKNKKQLGEVHRELVRIARKRRDGKALTASEQNIVDHIGEAKFNSLQLQNHTDRIIADRNNPAMQDTYYAISGRLNTIGTMRRIKKEDIQGMAPDNIKDPYYQDLAAQLWPISKFGAVSETYPNLYNDFIQGTKRVPITQLEDENSKLISSAFFGNNTFLLDQDFNAQFANGTTALDASGNPIKINKPQRYKEYHQYIQNHLKGDKTALPPKWMESGPATPGPAPTGEREPKMPRDPRKSPSTPESSIAGSLPFGASIPGAEGENVAARETERIKKDIERTEREGRERLNETKTAAETSASTPPPPPPTGTQPPASGASLPWIITRQVEQQLYDLGYNKGDVNKMTATEAQEMIKGQRTKPRVSTVQATPAQAPPTTPTPIISMPPNPSMSFFSNTLPQITLGDLEKGPMNGYAGGRLLKYENSSMAGIEVHPHSPGMISLRTVLAPGMQGMPKKVRIIADWGSTSINNGQAIPIGKKSIVEIDDKKFTISKNFTLMEIKDKK